MKCKNVWYLVFTATSTMSFAYFLIDFVNQTPKSSDWSLAGIKMILTLGALVVILASWFISNKDERG